MTTPSNPPIILPPAGEGLKVYSVRELPQSRQIPRLYNREFELRVISETQQAIKALRTDMKYIYTVLESLIASSNDHRTLLIEIDSRMDTAESTLQNHESRISALETP